MAEGGITDIGFLPPGLANFFTLDSQVALHALILAIVLVVVSLFIYEFYKSISRKNLLRLNLYKYNTTDHPLSQKFFAILLYLLEYIIIIPFIIALWFAALSVVLILISKNSLSEYVLLVAAAMIGAVRILAYFRGEIAKDLAKLFPFITLSVVILSPGEFIYDYSSIVSKLLEIPSLFTLVLSHLLILLLIEIVLRVLFTMIDFWRSEDAAIKEEEGID